MRSATIAGLGTALPETTITNDDLAAWLDTDDEWIASRSGIRRRRVARPEETTVTLGAAAARQALEASRCAPADIGLLVVATTTPVTALPGDAARIHDALGLRCGAFDLVAACTGFVHALLTAHAQVAAGMVDRALVVGTETLSRIVDPTDRTTAVLFGDGAGAAVVAAVPAGPGAPGLLGWDAGCDGSSADLLEIPPGAPYLRMDGPAIYRRAVRAMSDSTTAALEQAKLQTGDVDLLVAHQANARIVEATAQRLGIPPERTVLALESTGNTSAASVPLALAEADAGGRLHPGSIVALTAVGAGLSWASAIVRWGAP